MPQVDAHNIVPVWLTSGKLEYAARTIRNKVHLHLNKFLQEFPPLPENAADSVALPTPTDWEKAKAFLEVDRTVKEVGEGRKGEDE